MMKHYTKILLMAIALSSTIALAQNDNTSTTNNDGSRGGLSPGGIFVEPLISYSQEESTIKTSQLPIINDDTSGTSTGYGVGARLGFHLGEVVFLGADGRYSRAQFDDSSYGNVNGSVWSLGPTLGVQMPRFGLRVWGTYVTTGEFNPEAGRSNFDIKFQDPRGYRVGAGFRIASLSLNLEYQDITYNKTEVESFGSTGANASTGVDFGTKGVIASVSFPVQL